MKRSILFILSIILFLYVGSCLYVSFKVDKIINASYDSYGEVNTYPKIISDLNFRRLNYRSNYYKNHKKIYEENWRLFPLTFITFNKAKSLYWYTYKSSCLNCSTTLYFPVQVFLELKNFKWVITDVFHMP